MRRLSMLLAALVLLFATLTVHTASPARAQVLAPLTGPVVAATPARMDRIILYDMAGERRELSFGGYEHQVWGFSPDGCRVMFTLAESMGLPRAYVAALDGSGLAELVAYSEQSAGTWGVWEPDWSAIDAEGTSRIAFTMLRDRAEPDGEIVQDTHIGFIDGGAPFPQEPEFYSVTGREYTPRWSPDGAWLAYVSYDERVPGADPLSTAVPTQEIPEGQPVPPSLPGTMVREADLWVVSGDGETKYRLTGFETGSMRDPRWSPDGSLIGFVYSPSANNDTFWMIANDRGAIPTPLSDLWNLTLDMTWLPDGTAMIAAVRDFRGISENRLWRIPLVGNADNDATLYLDNPAYTHADYPRFSPDGRYLAFRAAYVLTIIDTLGGTSTQPDVNLPGNTPPVWTPAAFTDERDCS